jgi:hypothetical protein
MLGQAVGRRQLENDRAVASPLRPGLRALKAPRASRRRRRAGLAAPRPREERRRRPRASKSPRAPRRVDLQLVSRQQPSLPVESGAFPPDPHPEGEPVGAQEKSIISIGSIDKMPRAGNDSDCPLVRAAEFDWSSLRRVTKR